MLADSVMHGRKAFNEAAVIFEKARYSFIDFAKVVGRIKLWKKKLPRWVSPPTMNPMRKLSARLTVVQMLKREKKLKRGNRSDEKIRATIVYYDEVEQRLDKVRLEEELKTDNSFIADCVLYGNMTEKDMKKIYSKMKLYCHNKDISIVSYLQVVISLSQYGAKLKNSFREIKKGSPRVSLEKGYETDFKGLKLRGDS